MADKTNSKEKIMADDKQTKKVKDELAGSLSERELEILLNRYKEKGKKEKDPKPKKDPVTGAEYLYAKKGGLVKKSKVAGRLAKRGYGRAMKSKK
jgi:hypothetical protein